VSVLVPRRIFSSAAARGLLAALFAFTLCASTLFARQQPQQGAAQTLKLDRIEFKGLEKVKESDALAKSGLQPGQSVTVDDVEAAANRLLDSGLFQNLSYQIKGKTDSAGVSNVVVTFTVIEPKGGLPVVFDNFVWFTDDELKQAVRSRVPAYDGTAPDASTEQIRKALEDLLRERRIEGTVKYTLSADASGRKLEHLFSVEGPALRVCKINYVGARAIPEETLVQKSGGIFDNDYSRSFIAGFVESNLLPLYRERGYLRASFAPPKAKPDSTADCEKGVGLTFYVDEGAIYVWNKATWEGNTTLSAQELDAALAMKPREIANAVKIQKGLKAIQKAYGRKGYLEAQIRAVPDFDDEARSVAYRMQVVEGPQYHMGELAVKGLSEEDANNLRGRWRLLHGDVYDEGYADEFVKKTMPEFMKDEVRAGRPLPAMKVGVQQTPGREKHTVDVTLELKPEFAPGAKPQTNP
jgi:outer membrane protein insertion porin family